MTLAATYTHYGVYLNTTSPTMLTGITRQNLVTNSQVNGEPTSGEIYRRFQALYSQKLAPGWTTLNLANALGAIGVTGLSIGDLVTGLELYAQKNQEAGTRASGSTHRKFLFTEGIIVPRRLTCEHQGDASLEYEALVTYDGSNDPVQITESSALPGTITDSERFTMGGCTIGGKTFSGKQSLEIDFGVNARSEGGDSDIWDTFAWIQDIQPTVTLRGMDPEWFKATNVPLVGLAATHANSTIYLRKRSATGFVADGTEEHIAITVDGLIVPDEAFSFDGSTGTVSMTLPLEYDGTNAPLTIDTASAIT